MPPASRTDFGRHLHLPTVYVGHDDVIPQLGKLARDRRADSSTGSSYQYATLRSHWFHSLQFCLLHTSRAEFPLRGTIARQRRIQESSSQPLSNIARCAAFEPLTWLTRLVEDDWEW